jgi:hypothetical protein
MKTIKEAAREYADNRPYLLHEPEKVKYYTSFMAGVEFAQKWISVEDELPEAGYGGEVSDTVLIKDDFKHVGTGRYWIEDKQWIQDVPNKYYATVTHWRRIEIE